MIPFNNLYNTTITLIINGEQYVLNQEPETAIAFADERTIEGKRTQTGNLITYGTNQQNSYNLDFSIINVPKAIGNLLMTTWEQNLKNNNNYRFSIVITGTTDSVGTDGAAEIQKVTFSNCALRQSPIMVELGQQIGAIRLMVLAGGLKCE